MQCPKCSREWSDEFEFCPKCGVSLSARNHGEGVSSGVGGDIHQQSGGVSLDTQGDTSVGGDVAGRDKIIHGDQFVGDKFEIILDEERLRQLVGQTNPQDLHQATQRYLQYVVDRYRYLNFRGMGVLDRLPLRLALLDLYVPLKARLELPRGETWARGPATGSGQSLRLAGRRLSDEDREHVGGRLSEPRPVMDLLDQFDGLVILGDPGAGKTTFLKFLAIQLAAGSGTENRLPVLAPLSAYANTLAERDVRLDDFIVSYFHNLGADLPLGTMLRQALDAGSATVMLDGLDEVKDVRLRDTVVRRVVDFYAFHRRAGNKFLLTSRIVGYRDVRPTAEGLAECTLVDFDKEEIAAFVTRWTSVIEKTAYGETQEAEWEADRERRELIEAVQRNSGIQHLAANPLLLTILALMKRQGVTLPERRVELYDKYVETLLSSWNRARGLGRPPARDLDVVETVKALAPLALWMHQANPGVGLAEQDELIRQLAAIYAMRGEERHEQVARQFLADVREYTGLLLERGTRQYGFIHLTFEEYLAATALAQLGQQSVKPIISALSEHIGDPAWHEVSLLTVGYLGIVQKRDQAAGAVVEGLVAYDKGEAQAAHERGEAVALAGEAVADAWPSGVAASSKAKVVKALLATMVDDKQVKPHVRARAGDALARLGDLRPGVGLQASGAPDFSGVPAIVWCNVPGGAFLMGEGGGRHKASLPAFRIAKYPVTNAQYAAFVQDGGYTDKWHGCWTEAGWQQEDGHTRLDMIGGNFDLPNHPVVGISWYEAVAYCRWLTECLRAAGEIVEGYKIALPSEAQWEKAARGVDGRVYPWGDNPDSNRANYDDTGIGSTSAVGCFPGGASPYGCMDMSGNVDEWTRSIYGGHFYQTDEGREDLEGEDFHVIRGGAFDVSAGSVRCAYSYLRRPHYRSRYVGLRVVLLPPSDAKT